MVDLKIDTSTPVLVTGATGYVAGVLIKQLLEAGVTVHATVRDPSKTDRLKYLTDLADSSKGSIKFFKGDLMEEGSFEEGMKDCAIVFHTASPFVTTVADPQKDLIDPAVNGTRYVLNQASKTPSVKRVVLTSSCAAIYTDAADTLAAPNQVLTEDVWNTTASLSHQPYSYSKTLAEKEAWKIADEQDKWKLVVVNPSLVMGPGLKYSGSSTSFSLCKQCGDGTLKYGAPKFGMAVVDVREVARAHILAAYKPDAKGRHILVAENTSLFGFATTLEEKYGKDYPIPKSAVPKFLLYLVGPFMGMSWKVVWNNVNVDINLDNSKSKNELGVEYRPLKETMEDMFQQCIDSGVFEKK